MKLFTHDFPSDSASRDATSPYVKSSQTSRILRRLQRQCHLTSDSRETYAFILQHYYSLCCWILRVICIRSLSWTVFGIGDRWHVMSARSRDSEWAGSAVRARSVWPTTTLATAGGRPGVRSPPLRAVNTPPCPSLPGRAARPARPGALHVCTQCIHFLWPLLHYVPSWGSFLPSYASAT